jgi:hypothetical protein
MTQDKIENILHNSKNWNVGVYKVNEQLVAKEIYKLHLESQLELLHTINDIYYKPDNEESDMPDIVGTFCFELETKLKELG